MNDDIDRDMRRAQREILSWYLAFYRIAAGDLNFKASLAEWQEAEIRVMGYALDEL